MTGEHIEKTIRRVAVIGGGPGGIAAIRALKKEDSFSTITVYERNEQIGGAWLYSPERDPPPTLPSTNALQVDDTLKVGKTHSPIYANLHTNLPTTVMSYRDVPFDNKTPCFPSHVYVLKYLQDIVEHEGLMPMIKLSTRVDKVDYHSSWTVTSTNLKTGEQSEEEFDAVVVANGHYTVPYIPDIPGIDGLHSNKRVEALHSRDYREPSIFRNKTVLVVGGSYSGLDIVREASSVAHRIYHCIRTQTELTRQASETNTPNVVQIGLLKGIVCTADTCIIECSDGQQLQNIDIVVFATGYLFSFPFLPFQENNLIQTGQKVHNLLHYMFYARNKTLCFIGVPIRVAPFPLMQRQCTVMARYWSGKIPILPFKEEIGDKDSRNDITMGVDRECEYNNLLGAWAEGWIGRDMNEWDSQDVITGRLSNEWIDTRKNALRLRKEYLGY
ncbi:FAD/NAD(P)-binding domain-containing protein [Rhizopus microsporus var. microsporus]|nr:FAD/NAD(P)-binding domain-containing protein [Rhizopus microsporus var. microsporus]